MWISIMENGSDNMTDVDNPLNDRNHVDNSGVEKFDHHKYGELFHRFFKHKITESSEGLKVTWRLITKKHELEGWILLQPVKRTWKRKPIMGSGGFQIIDSKLNPIHEFMDKYIIYEESSPLIIRKFFIDEAMKLMREFTNPTFREGENS